MDTPGVARLLESSDDAEQSRQQLTLRQPMGRLVTADEVANAIAYLASPLSASTTGTLLTVEWEACESPPLRAEAKRTGSHAKVLPALGIRPEDAQQLALAQPVEHAR